MNVGSNNPFANRKESALKSNKEQALRKKFSDNPFNLNAVNDSLKTQDAESRSMASVGWGRHPAIHPWAFRGRPKETRGTPERYEGEEKDVRTASTAGNLTRGSAPIHSTKLKGPRISHIGNQSATVATTMLQGLATGQSKTGTIFQQPNYKSRARALGRPLGYGTVYKFI